jgi:hypothetical protein
MIRASDFEKLGVFYLGRPFDLAAKKPEPGLVLYDSKDLVTHAVCVGMTGSATTAARGAGRVLKERQDVSRATETVEAYKQELADLDAQMKAETDALAAASDALSEPLQTLHVRPTKQDVMVKLVALAWAPAWRDSQGHVVDAWR